MALSLLFPRFHHAAIEEQYATLQSQLFLRRAHRWSEWVDYDPEQPVAEALAPVSAPKCVVVTDPLVLVASTFAELLEPALADGVIAAVPVTNETDQEEQRAPAIEPYLTIRQFETIAEKYARNSDSPRLATGHGDPGLFLCRTESLRGCRRPAREALEGAPIAVVPTAYVHRWTRLRSQPRTDLLPYVPVDARNILEFGCAEGLFGEQVKRRQECRYVGMEMDESAAIEARRRLDQVHTGDARRIVTTLDEKFDCIIGGDVLEHLDDPWTFLTQLRAVAARNASLVLSVPNIANAAILADLLQNRFDYAYIAITCAGHLRFFTRNTITDTLEITGWRVETIEPQATIANDETRALVARLQQCGLTSAPDDLSAPGFYVVARNDG
jgi:2-polyprenyl-3-methyl-5-hydroxy-6-metoxy-1,4-benzoquinol methylase